MGATQRHTHDGITARLLLPMVLEATRILEEGRVRDPRDIDLAVLFGLGFPAFRGGLLWWVDTLGAERIIEMLQPLQRLGPRGQSTSLLQRLAATHGRFYDSAAGRPAAAMPIADKVRDDPRWPRAPDHTARSRPCGGGADAGNFPSVEN